MQVVLKKEGSAARTNSIKSIIRIASKQNEQKQTNLSNVLYSGGNTVDMR